MCGDERWDWHLYQSFDICGLQHQVFKWSRKKGLKIPLFDTLITSPEDGSVVSSAYRKPTHINQYLSLQSHYPLEHFKRSVVCTLLHRADVLSSNSSIKGNNINTLNQHWRTTDTRDGNCKLKNQLKYAGVQGPHRPRRGPGSAPLKKMKLSHCEPIFYGFPARKK
jgi:hypothetical protein